MTPNATRMLLLGGGRDVRAGQRLPDPPRAGVLAGGPVGAREPGIDLQRAGHADAAGAPAPDRPGRRDPRGRDLRGDRRRRGRARVDGWSQALETVDPYDRVGFHIAFGMLPLVPREAGRSPACTRRRVALEREVEAFVREQGPPENGPPHARRALGALDGRGRGRARPGCARRSRTSRPGGCGSRPTRTGAGRRPPTTPGGRWTPTGRSTARCWAGVLRLSAAALPLAIPHVTPCYWLYRGAATPRVQS